MARIPSSDNIEGSYVAGADLTARQFRFVRLSTTADNTVIICGAGEKPFGVLLNKPNTGETAQIAPCGTGAICTLEVDGAAGAIVRGDALASDADGQGVVDATDGAQVGAIAQQTSSALGDLITVALRDATRQSAP